MPNGDDKNWVRLCIAVEGFRARYQKWPETALLSKGLAENIKRMFKPLDYEAVLTKLEIVEVEDAYHIELVDKAGNSFKYGKNGISSQVGMPAVGSESHSMHTIIPDLFFDASGLDLDTER